MYLAKYIYNYFSFFDIKILVWRFSIDAQNFQFTTKPPMFLAIVAISLFSFSLQGVGKDILIDEFSFADFCYIRYSSNKFGSCSWLLERLGKCKAFTNTNKKYTKSE